MWTVLCVTNRRMLLHSSRDSQSRSEWLSVGSDVEVGYIYLMYCEFFHIRWLKYLLEEVAVEI